MYLLRLWHLIYGFVEISVTQGFRSTFIEMCKNMGINLWSIRAKGDEMRLRISVEDVSKLRTVARKSGMRVKILKKRGLPFLIYRYRGRIGIPVGAIIFCLLIFMLSGYVWTINYELSDTDISEEQLSATLSDLGLNVGAKIDDIDFYMLQNDCLLEIDSLNWIGISREGTRVTVKARDRDESPELYTEETPCSVRAEKDGQILSVVPYEGRTVVTIGDTVKKGDIIVSGISMSSYGDVTLSHARADVTARTYYTEKVFVPFDTEERVRTGESESVKSLFFFGKRINFSLNSGNYGDEYDIIYSTDYIEILGVTLPVGIITTTYEKYENQSFTRNEDEMLLAAEEEIRKREEQNLSHTSIIERNVNGVKTDEGYEITVKYECREDIGFEEVILDEEYENTVTELREKLATT